MRGCFSLKKKLFARRRARQCKAVLNGSLPTSVWHLCPESLSEHFVNLANKRWVAGDVWYQEEWSDSDLRLLPKPGKATKLPRNLRQSRLQDPGEKCVVRIPRVRLLCRIDISLQRHPQYAYIPRKSIDQAVSTVSEHCYVMRDALLRCGADDGLIM